MSTSAMKNKMIRQKRSTEIASTRSYEGCDSWRDMDLMSMKSFVVSGSHA